MNSPLPPPTPAQHPPSSAAPASSRPFARWGVAVIAIVYGFAKLNGSQFTMLDSELDKPMGTVSGFWLTWHYFGYSPVYGNLIAVIQIAGGLLVTQPRFALAGALLLLPVATNILLVDIFYGVDLGGTLAAVILLGLLVWILAPHAGRLVEAVVPPRAGRRNPWRRVVAPLALVVAAFGWTYWVANYNNRAPTEVDGIWVVEVADISDGAGVVSGADRSDGAGAPDVAEAADAADPGGVTDATAAAGASIGTAGADASAAPGVAIGPASLERVFFERNRAYMVVLKDTSGHYTPHHFELEPDGRLRVWEEWLTRGTLLFEGTFTPPDRIHLRRVDGAGGDAVELRRLSP